MNIKKILFIIAISLLFLTESIAEIKDSLFISVGKKAVTKSDVIDEIKMILILNNQSFVPKKKEILENAAIQSLIKRNIKQIELEKFKLGFNRADLDRELDNFAENLNIDLETLINLFKSNEIDFSKIVDQIKTELLWNSLIFKLYQNRLVINKDEIDEQLKLLQNKKKIEEFLISEIIIEPVAAEKVESEVNKIINMINAEGFEKVAMNFSISETALKGGNMGWISENIISDQFKKKIMRTAAGSLSEPILLPEGILIFKVRDRRKVEKVINLEEAKDQLVNAEKTKILNMYSLSHYDKLKRSISIKYYE